MDTVVTPCYCRCGAVLGLWMYEGAEYPFVRDGVMHSPMGCLRGVRQGYEIRSLYHRCTGFPYYGSDESALFQALMSALERNPEFAATIPGLVLTEGGHHPAREYVPEGEIPRNQRGSSRGGGTGHGTVKPPPRPPPGWDPATGSVKPPWVK